MQKKNGLRLQSYKIDTSQLQSKIYELDQLKSDLRSSLAQQREQQLEYQGEIKKLEKQNHKDKIKGMELTIASQNNLIEQLEKKIQRIEQQMYHAQEQSQEQKQKRKEIQTEYKMQIDSLTSQIEHMKKSTDFQLRTSNVIPIQQSKDVNKALHYSESYIPSSSSISTEGRKIKRLKKKENRQSPEKVQENHLPAPEKSIQEESVLPMGVRQKWNTQPIAEGEDQSQLTAEDIYLEMIRQLYRQLAKIDLKAKDLPRLPTINSFSQHKSPTHQDLSRLLASHPFQISASLKSQAIHSFLSHQLQKQHREVSGRQILSEIVESLEEIELERELSMMSSGLSDLKDSEMYSSVLKRVSRPMVNALEEQMIVGSGETIPELSETSDCQ